MPTAPRTALLTTHECPDRWVSQTGRPPPARSKFLPGQHHPGLQAEPDHPLLRPQSRGMSGHRFEDGPATRTGLEVEGHQAQAERGGVAVGVVETRGHHGAVQVQFDSGRRSLQLLVEADDPTGPDPDRRGAGPTAVDGEHAGIADDQVEHHRSAGRHRGGRSGALADDRVTVPAPEVVSLWG